MSTAVLVVSVVSTVYTSLFLCVMDPSKVGVLLLLFFVWSAGAGWTTDEWVKRDRCYMTTDVQRKRPNQLSWHFRCTSSSSHQHLGWLGFSPHNSSRILLP